MSLPEAIRRNRSSPLTYTFVPPSRDASPTELDAVADTLQRVLATAPVDAIHVPEVRPDPRSPRSSFVPKLAPRAFARSMARRITEAPAWLLDRGIVDHHWTHQERWLDRTIHDQGFSSLMLVGGASRTIRYPGPSVTEATPWVRAAYGDQVCLGGIVIPTREGEIERLMAKTAAGLDVFVTQILGESSSTAQLLMDYHRACRERGWRPRPILASVAPAANRGDVEFLESWGVRFDPGCRRHILGSSMGVGWRSIGVAAELLEALMEVRERAAPTVPLGVNVEHARARNVEISAELLESVAQVLREGEHGRIRG